LKKRRLQVLFGFYLLRWPALELGQSTIFILVPQEIRSLGFNEFQVGLIFSISALAWIFFSPYWGRLSDRIGRSKVFMLGIIGFAISLFLFAAIIKFAQLYPISFSLLFVLLIGADS